jgi:hypothetical protein
MLLCVPIYDFRCLNCGFEHDREERRWEGFRQQREQIGLPPRGPRKDS